MEKTIAKNSLLLFIIGIIFNLREPFILDPAKLPPQLEIVDKKITDHDDFYFKIYLDFFPYFFIIIKCLFL